MRLLNVVYNMRHIMLGQNREHLLLPCCTDQLMSCIPCVQSHRTD